MSPLSSLAALSTNTSFTGTDLGGEHQRLASSVQAGHLGCLSLSPQCDQPLHYRFLRHHRLGLYSFLLAALSKRVIYEYHRIEVPVEKVVSNTIVILHAQPSESQSPLPP